MVLSLGESNTDSPSAVLFCSFVFVLLALRQPRLNPQTPTGHFGNIATRILPKNLA